MLTIGLCGGSGSGKGAVSNFFSIGGYVVADTDKICHELFSNSEECISQLASEFGREILDKDGCIDRKKLSEIVFSDKAKLKRLNEISHYHILNKVREIISDARVKGEKGVVVDAPLLFESGFDAECDLVVAVYASEKERISRIMARDSISEEKARARLKNQLDDEYIIKKSDFAIENNGSLSLLKSKVDFVMAEIRKRYLK